MPHSVVRDNLPSQSLDWYKTVGLLIQSLADIDKNKYETTTKNGKKKQHL